MTNCRAQNPGMQGMYYLLSFNELFKPISHGVKQDTLDSSKYFLTDLWLFLYTYPFCYISGPPIQEGRFSFKTQDFGAYRKLKPKAGNCRLRNLSREK